MRLVRSELLKIRTTSIWWVLGLIGLPLWGITLFFNYLQSQFILNPPDDVGLTGEEAAELQALSDVVNVAANLYTNGQFFGVLLAMLLGAVVVTSEFHHQTATTTFLVTPRRTAVVLAKLAAASLVGLGFWAVTTVLNLLFGSLLLGALDTGSQLGAGGVWRAIALNGLAYLFWAVFGVGLGVLIPNQLGVTVTAILLYLAGYIGSALLFALLASRFGDWIDDLQVLVPSYASQLMVAGTDLPGSPPRWLGAVVLVGYGVLTGAIGTLIMRRRDIS